MARLFAFDAGLWDPSHRFQTSWLVSPYVLGAVRLFISLYAFTTLLFNIGYACVNASHGGCETARNSFSYFTVLSYWGVAFYFLVAAVHTLIYARRGSAPLDNWPRSLQFLHSLLYGSITTFPILVVIVFWALLSAPTTLSTTYSAWSNISEHALNGALALFEIIIPRTRPTPWSHLPFLILLLALYLALAYLTQATKGFYTYPFLDPSLQGALVAAYVFGIAIGICIIFAVVWGITWLRRWITENKLGLDGVFAHASAVARTDEQDARRSWVHKDVNGNENGHGMTEINPAV
ncbi:hypothetical protein F5B22DRAFT_498323 [Xylaria bambusicola]|uniref:uncharacterized protein n=1 Tax=Xylaria bambusicola TaxID=326684 RepID=UPI002008D552|nr:uncharacterized protein F5B22DRAFT_498323 [Xylaria bambusicola]KAI0505681.1 hypothetical protein F5B22DRAFT_498323 [Xylaria bambusicola]